MANCSYDTTGFKDVPCEILNFSGFGKIPHGAMTTGKDNGPVITRIYMKVTRLGQDKNDMESSLLLNLMNLKILMSNAINYGQRMQIIKNIFFIKNIPKILILNNKIHFEI